MTNTVIVCSKLPYPQRLRVGNDSIIIHGVNQGRERGKVANLIMGYNKTRVDADLWEAWVKANPKHRLLTCNIIWADAKEANVDAKGKELAAEKTGTEGLDVTSEKGDTRLAGAKVETEDTSKATVKATIAKNKASVSSTD